MTISDGTTTNTATDATDRLKNTWYLMSCRSSGAANRDIAINGGTIYTNTASRSPSGLDRFWVGRMKTGSSFANYFQGQIEMMSVWGRVLLDSEIDQLYADLVSPFALSNQANHIETWRFDSIVGGEVVGLKGGTVMTISGATISAEDPGLTWPVFGAFKAFWVPRAIVVPAGGA